MVQAGVAIGGAGTVPQRVPRIEERLLGERPTEATLDEAVRLSTEVVCIADAYVTADYRRHLVGVLIRRALALAARRAAGML